jgi:Tol biopolymer transport system component
MSVLQHHVEKTEDSRGVTPPEPESDGVDIPKTAPKVLLKMDKQRPLTPKNDFMAPKWSHDGLDVLVSKGKFNGLYLVSEDGNDIRRISDAPGVGYRARWSDDGNYIIAEQEDGTIVYDRSGRQVDATLAKEHKPPIYAENGVVYRRQGPERSEADESIIADEDQYFEPVTSPDEAKIAYIGLESGIIIKDLQTMEDVYIGQGTDIRWLPDGSGIIFNYTQDDGQKIIDGDIYFGYADGRGVENLTNTPNVIERRPYLSGDGSELVYEVDGQIFSVEMEVQ